MDECKTDESSKVFQFAQIPQLDLTVGTAGGEVVAVFREGNRSKRLVSAHAMSEVGCVATFSNVPNLHLAVHRSSGQDLTIRMELGTGQT